MLNKTNTVTTRRNSRAVAQKRRIRNLIAPQTFAQIFQGKINLSKKDGVFYCGFTSVTQKAHAWGHSFPRAYRNMLRNFHLKYGV